MNILYDARWIRTDGVSDGVSRYSQELAKAMVESGEANVSFLICSEKQRALLPAGADCHLISDPNNATKELFVAFTINTIVKNNSIDVVYSPFFMIGTLGKRYPLVLTIHDLIYFHFRTPPQWLPQITRLGWWLFHASKWPMRLQLNRADHIATVSETARKELIKWRMTKRPITTVCNAATLPEIHHQNLHRHESNTLVYMGAFTPYKNVECLVEAMAFLPTEKLHLLSKIPASRKKELTELIQKCDVTERVQFHDGVSDKEYVELLNDCRCLLTASRLEGFGLPLVEAQSAGVPVVCSDTPIFHEVAGEGALFFNPDEPATCAQAIEQLSQAKIVADLIKKGRENTQRFSWAQSADAVFEITLRIAAL